MAVLVANIPHETDLGVVEVENRLAPGKYRFRLTVSDDSKNESVPVFLVVTVNEAQPRDPIGEIRVDRRVFERVPQPNIGDAFRGRVPRRPGG